MSKQARLLAEAHQHMPQGVAENYRYWGEQQTVFISSAKGCTLTDADGRTFVDFRLGYGPIILGYRDERVDQAVIEQIIKPVLPKELVKGKIKDMVYFGNFTVYRLQLPSGQLLKVSQSNTERHPDHTLTWDDEAWAWWSPTAQVVLTL